MCMTCVILTFKFFGMKTCNIRIDSIRYDPNLSRTNQRNLEKLMTNSSRNRDPSNFQVKWIVFCERKRKRKIEFKQYVYASFSFSPNHCCRAGWRELCVHIFACASMYDVDDEIWRLYIAVTLWAMLYTHSLCGLDRVCKYITFAAFSFSLSPTLYRMSPLLSKCCQKGAWKQNVLFNLISRPLWKIHAMIFCFFPIRVSFLLHPDEKWKESKAKWEIEKTEAATKSQHSNIDRLANGKVHWQNETNEKQSTLLLVLLLLLM